MQKKEDILSKMKLKDYNSILENVLEQKDFSENVKNLLLSMFYKIENGFQDYKTVKVNVSQKNYFLEKLINAVKDKCFEIELVKPMSKKSEVLENLNVNYLVDREKGKITCYQNERILLEAVVSLSQKEIELNEYKLYRKGLEEILHKGNCMSISEVIRDFNGWSWDVTTSQMQSKNINLIYQNLLILLGKNFLQNWITGEEKEEIEETQMPNNEILRSKYNDSFGIKNEEMQEKTDIDYIKTMQELLEEKFGEKSGQDFLEELKKVIISIGYNTDETQKDIILQEKNNVEENLNKMQDNKMFVEEVSKNKRDLIVKIKNIDKLLSDEKLLKKEYERRNRKLPNEKKIFSASHLKLMLEKERNDKLDKIKELNKQMEPNEFVKIKKETQKKYEFFQDIEIQKDKKINEERLISRLQILFLNCFIEKIKRAENRIQLKNLIYELRYYECLPYNDIVIHDINDNELQEKLCEAEKLIVKKACVAKILTTFTKEDNLNKKIIENQFRTKIINLENINYTLKYHKGILKIDIYDTNIHEETKQIEITQKVELEVKLNRKIKLWE